MRVRGFHITSVGSGKVADPGVTLWSVNVNTAGTGAILKLYQDVAATSSLLIATIDCGSVGSLWYGIYSQKGLWYDLSVASADITIGFS